MLAECLQVFRKELEHYGERMILDGYILVDGTYLLVDSAGEIITVMDIQMDKKTRQIDKSNSRYRDFCYYDWHSKLISTQKPQDSSKIIHSNNYLSFWVKKDNLKSGKLKQENIDQFYECLSHPESKYDKKKKSKVIYQNVREILGEVDQEKLKRCHKWISEHIWELENIVSDIELDRNGYLKIFFEDDYEQYEKEEKRYLLPNIYNKNDYNVEVQGETLGLPNDNLGMNAKKPYLAMKTRKCAAPYLLNSEQVLLQKQFFDYLMNQVAVGKNNLYVDMERQCFFPCSNTEYPKGTFRGIYLRLEKGMEVEIHSQDVIPYYNNRLKEPFVFENHLKLEHKKHPDYQYAYTKYHHYSEIEQLIDEIFFSKELVNLYHTEIDNIRIKDGILKQNLLVSRECLFDWLHKGIDRYVYTTINKCSLELIKGLLIKGYQYREKAARQLNLRWSLQRYLKKGGKDMPSVFSEVRNTLREKVRAKDTMEIESADEYYFAVGQLAAYFISLNKSVNKKQSLINTFVNAKTDKGIKERIKQCYIKYNYRIDEADRRTKNLIAMVEGYEPDAPVNQEMIITGYACSNLINETEEKQHE